MPKGANIIEKILAMSKNIAKYLISSMPEDLFSGSANISDRPGSGNKRSDRGSELLRR